MLNLYLLCLILLASCSKVSEGETINGLRTNLIIESEIFKVSYNEVYEQPNWIEYRVRSIEKKYDRDGMDFYEVDSVHTSDDDDYYNNKWDKGHLAPAAAFTDTNENLKATFSYLNCALQHQSLNRSEWSQLESNVRKLAKLHGTLSLRIDVEFSDNHFVLPTGASVPSGFTKRITFPNGDEKCYYFLNEKPEENWDQYLLNCK